MSTILLINGSLIAYSAARIPKKLDPEGFARQPSEVESNCESWIHNLFYELESKYGITATHYKIFLDGENDFRRIIYPLYKSTQRIRTKPPLVSYAKQYLKEHYNAFISHGVSSSDSIAATWKAIRDLNKDVQVIVCSMENNLQTLPCLFFDTHYSSRKLHKITTEESMLNFYRRLLIGDKECSIEGLHAIGETKADRILGGLLTKKQMLRRVYREYIKHYGRKARRKFELNYLLLKLVVSGINYPTEFEEINF